MAMGRLLVWSGVHGLLLLTLLLLIPFVHGLRDPATVPEPPVRLAVPDWVKNLKPPPDLLGSTSIKLTEPEIFRDWAARLLAAAPNQRGNLTSRPDLELALRNELIRLRGGAALPDDPRLSDIARLHALDQLGREYDGHLNPEGRGPIDRVALLDRSWFGTFDELLVRVPSGSTVADSVAALLKPWQSGRATLNSIKDEDRDWKAAGIGVAEKDGQLTAVVLLAAPRGRLKNDLPLKLSAGVPLDLQPFAPSTPVDLFNPQTGVATEKTFSARDGVTAPPGQYRLRLYLGSGTANSEIVSGPEVWIVP
jgi:hypothetical protein